MEAETKQEIPKDPSPYLFCDNCGHYPIKPMHGHYVCPACFMPTKCCEAGPIPAAWVSAEKKD